MNTIGANRSSCLSEHIDVDVVHDLEYSREMGKKRIMRTTRMQLFLGCS